MPSVPLITRYRSKSKSACLSCPLNKVDKPDGVGGVMFLIHADNVQDDSISTPLSLIRNLASVCSRSKCKPRPNLPKLVTLASYKLAVLSLRDFPMTVLEPSESLSMGHQASKSFPRVTARCIFRVSA